MDEDIKQVNKECAGNCVIYISATGLQKNFPTVGRSSMADRSSSCVSLAQLYNLKIVGFFKDTQRFDFEVRTGLDRMYSFCFDPSNNVTTVIVPTSASISSNSEYYANVRARLSCLGIDLLTVYEEYEVDDAIYAKHLDEWERASRMAKSN